jgi:hypothetical protein
MVSFMWDLHYMSKVPIHILSLEDWEWGIASLQMGVATVPVDALTQRAAETLSRMQLVVRGQEHGQENIDLQH